MENPFLQLLKLKPLRPYKFFLLYLICQQILLPLLLKYPQYLTISYHLHPGPNYPFTWFITTAANMVFLFLPLYSYYLLLDTTLLLCSKPSSRLSLHSRAISKILTIAYKSSHDVVSGYFSELISSLWIPITPALLVSLLFLKNAPNSLTSGLCPCFLFCLEQHFNT